MHRAKYALFLLFLALSLLIVFGYLSFPTATAANTPCDRCVVNHIYDIAWQEQSAERSKQLEARVTGQLSPVAEKIIAAEVAASTGSTFREAQLTKTYNEILAADPGITQKANLFRTIACAFEQHYCRSTVLAQPEKEARIERVIEEFEARIDRMFAAESPPDDPKIDEEPGPQAPSSVITSGQRQVSRSPEPEPPTPHDYVSTNQAFDIALLNRGENSAAISGAIRIYLDRQGYKVSRSYFTSAFTSAFGPSVWRGDGAAVRDLGLAAKLPCICTVSTSLSADKKTYQGREFSSVNGPTTLQLILLGSDETFTFPIHTAGAGPSSDPTLALKDYADKLLTGETFASIPFHLCR